MGCDIPKFRNVQKLKCAAAEGCARRDPAPIGEGYSRFGWLGLNLPFDESPQFGQGDIFFRGIIGRIIQALVGQIDFADFPCPIHQGFVDDAAMEIGPEQAHVQHQHGHIRGNAQLAGLQDVIPVPQLLMQFLLGPIQPEPLHEAILVDNPVEVIQPPHAVRKPFFQNLYVIVHYA